MTDLSTLVEDAREGNIDAYGVIVERFQSMAVTYAQARIGDFHLAQDAAQDTFVHAYLALDQLRTAAASGSGASRIGSWGNFR